MNRLRKIRRKFKGSYKVQTPCQHEPDEKLNLLREDEYDNAANNANIIINNNNNDLSTPIDNISNKSMTASVGSSQERTPSRKSIIMKDDQEEEVEEEEEEEEVPNPRNIPKFRLNFDLPEYDEEIATGSNNNSINSTMSDRYTTVVDDGLLEKTISVDNVYFSGQEDDNDAEMMKQLSDKLQSMKIRNNSQTLHVPQIQLTSLDGYVQIPALDYGTMSPEGLSTRERQVDTCYVQIEDGYDDGDDSIAKPGFDTTQEASTLDLPALSNCSYDKIVTKSPVVVVVTPNVHIVSSPQKEMFAKKLFQSSVVKISTFFSWCTEIWLRTGWRYIKKLVSVAFAKTPPPLPVESELSSVMSMIKCENERVLAVLSDVTQKQASNEATLTALVNNVKELTTELKALREKIVEARPEAVTLTHVSKIPPPPPMPSLNSRPSGPSGPPGPPPPPPPPLPSMPLFSAPKLNIAPASKDGKVDDTKKKKILSPFSDRPQIRVEDLMKVTLKKVPQKQKDSVRSNTLPEISLEMIRNVKLRPALSSTRRRSMVEQRTKSPRTTPSRINKNRSQTNLNNSSPVTRGLESSLLRLLKPPTPIKRARRIRSMPNSEVDSNNNNNNDDNYNDNNNNNIREVKLDNLELSASPKFDSKLDCISDSVFI